MILVLLVIYKNLNAVITLEHLDLIRIPLKLKQTPNVIYLCYVNDLEDKG